MRLWQSDMAKLVKQAQQCSIEISYFSSNQMIPNDVAYLRGELQKLKPDVIIVNWGAHYGKRNRNEVEEAYTNETRLMATMVAETTSMKGNAPMLIYRSTAPAHPNCASISDRPASDQELRKLWSDERAKAPNEQKSRQWQWDVFPKLNRLAHPLWSNIAGALPMGVEEMAKNRPDLHIDPTAAPGSLGFTGPDCLHYRKLACPGGFAEMNTWWTALLQNILESKSVHSKKKAFV
jgi:hypothetical protein